MNIEEQIALLEAKAAPLRCLPTDEQDRCCLGQIVDNINALRARQSKGETEAVPYFVVPIDTPALSYPPAPRRGRPPKVRLEGEDA